MNKQTVAVAKPLLKDTTKATQLSAIGWDIGGAHLKAVRLDSAGNVLTATQVYCPLWRGLNALHTALDKILAEMNADNHFVTMTGELADFFENRHAGVLQIAQLVLQRLGGSVQFYAGKQGFVGIDAVNANTDQIASMNWLASVQLVAQNVSQALFLDIGSTTTDIALIQNGQPQVIGFHDATRLQSDELVYTGVVRTPLMALAQKITFNSALVNLAAEHFATTADVYTLTGDLPLDENMADTADGANKSITACARRIARMVGMDSADAPISIWRNLACAFKHAQINQIKQAVLLQISRLEEGCHLHIVGCGVGDFLAFEVAKQLAMPYHSVTDFIASDNLQAKEKAAVCFPAFAVVSLGLQSSPTSC